MSMTTTIETKTSKTTYTKDLVITTSPARPSNSASERLIADVCNADYGISLMGDSMRQNSTIGFMLSLREQVDSSINAERLTFDNN